MNASEKTKSYLPCGEAYSVKQGVAGFEGQQASLSTDADNLTKKLQPPTSNFAQDAKALSIGCDSQPSSNVFMYSASTKSPYTIRTQVKSEKPNTILPKTHKSTSSYSEIMRQRWLKANEYLPTVDQKDICEEEPLANGNKVKPIESRVQAHAEFTQTSYLRIRQQEEGYLNFDYLDPKCNQNFQAYLASCKQQKRLLSQDDRSYAVQKIFGLHFEKKYKKETIFTAVSIFDRYLATIGFWTYPRSHILLLAIVSLLVAAKIEEPISPSFNRMISLLSVEDRKMVDKESLIMLEVELLSVLSFDYSAPGPMQSLERYLRLLEFQDNDLIMDMSYQICKFQLNDSCFLGFRPSQIAASTVIICVNIFKRDQEKYERSGVFKNGATPISDEASFFKMSNKPGQLLLNMDIWTAEIASVTGYTVDMLRRPLFQLSSFIRMNLQPDRLCDFDIDAIIAETDIMDDDDTHMPVSS